MVKKRSILFMYGCLLLMQMNSVHSDEQTYRMPLKGKKRRSSIFNAVDAPDADIKEVNSSLLQEDVAEQVETVVDAYEQEAPQQANEQEPTDQPEKQPSEQEVNESNINEEPVQPVQSEEPAPAPVAHDRKRKSSVFDASRETKEPTSSAPIEPNMLDQDELPTRRAENTKSAVPAAQEDTEMIEFYFEDADILNLLTQISEIFDGVHFITDEILDPLGPGGKALKGNKISFKTHKPLTKKAAWNLFLTFLDLAGFALVPEPNPGFYRVVTSEKAQKSPVPTYIGTDLEELPDNDQIIRYVYFIKNAQVDTIESMLKTLKSPNAGAVVLREIRAFVITDRAYNIRSLMQIVQELDQVTMPESMSVLKLVNADAQDVKKLYDDITKTADNQPASRFSARKQPTSIYFPENARIIAEPRTNSLILLGPADALKKVEEFISKHVDIELEQPYSPFQVYHLRYAKAATVAEIMNKMTEFGTGTDVGKAGGVRAGDKYLKPMSFVPDDTTNALVIKGDYEDYLKAVEIVKKLDEPQPQVAVEALILTINFDNAKELGTQLRNKIPGPNGLLGNNVDFQTSGLRAGGTPKGIVTRDSGSGSERLLGNLVSLVQNAVAGNTVVSLGTDMFGVWGIFNIFQSLTNTHVVSNPFLVATNKTKASVSVGTIRRVTTSTIFAGDNMENALGDFSAVLKLDVTPQINSDGMIVLELGVTFENFVGSLTNTDIAAKNTRYIETNTIVADKEVIAIGGLIQDTIRENMTKVPVLGDIPVFGWLFKNKRKEIEKNNLFILISTRIIEPEVTGIADDFTQEKLGEYYETVERFQDMNEQRDPIYKRFFENPKESSAHAVEEFLLEAQTQRATEQQNRSATGTKNFYQMQPSAPSSPVATQPAIQVAQNQRSSRRDARRSKAHKNRNPGVVT